jgi:hypothetical protein
LQVGLQAVDAQLDRRLGGRTLTGALAGSVASEYVPVARRAVWRDRG